VVILSDLVGQDCPSHSEELIVKPVPHFAIDLPGLEIVRSTEGQAVIEQETPVGYVNRLNGNGPALSKTLAQ